MLRVMTKDVGRLKKDSVKNYPKDVWEKIARDYVKSQHKLKLTTRLAGIDAKKVLDTISKEVPEGMGHDQAQRTLATSQRLRRISLKSKIEGRA